jgi:hypothetical protein
MSAPQIKQINGLTGFNKKLTGTEAGASDTCSVTKQEPRNEESLRS